jgi:hypothetical protein
MQYVFMLENGCCYCPSDKIYISVIQQAFFEERGVDGLLLVVQYTICDVRKNGDIVLTYSIQPEIVDQVSICSKRKCKKLLH